MTSPPPQLPSLSHNRASTGYLPTLDGWRAIAILLVMICHGGLFFFSPYGPHPSGRFQMYSTRAWIGVDIFFAISGFLICTRLLREQQRTGGINLRSFYIRRAFRILPPYLLYLAVAALLAAKGFIIVSRSEWFSCLLFFRNYLPTVHTRDVGWYTGHFWSLAVEEHFYLLWPAVLLLLNRRGATQAAFVLILAIAIWRVMNMGFGDVPLYAVQTFERHTDTRLDSLLWGCIFAMAFASESGRRWMTKWIGPIACCASAITVILLATRLNAICDALRPPLFALIVATTVVHPQWLIGRILEDPRVRWLGRISYSLYVWQQLFLVGDVVPRPLPFGHWQELPLSLICILACATASYYFIEQPLIRLGRRLARPQTSSSFESNSSLAAIASAASAT